MNLSFINLPDDKVIIFGDFNAFVGANWETSGVLRKAWSWDLQQKCFTTITNVFKDGFTFHNYVPIET